MSIDAIKWAFDQNIKSKGHEKFILVALADYANEDGFCYPAISTLCKKVSSSREAVCQGIKKLIAGGFIEKSDQLQIPKFYKKNQNVYKLLVRYSDQSDILTSQEIRHNQSDILASSSQNIRHKPLLEPSKKPSFKSYISPLPQNPEFQHEMPIENEQPETQPQAPLTHLPSDPNKGNGKSSAEHLQLIDAYRDQALMILGDHYQNQLEDIFDDFKDHQLDRGYLSANWGSSWRKWCRKAKVIDASKARQSSFRDPHVDNAPETTEQTIARAKRLGIVLTREQVEGEGDVA